MKTALLIFGLLLLAGCAGNKVPVMPKYNTQPERACARTCQDAYVKCDAPCAQLRDGLVRRTGAECTANCIQMLKDCYASCEQGPEPMEKKGI
jgi:hypothetical protein